MWCMSAVKRTSLLLRAASRTPSNPIDAPVRLCVRGAGGGPALLLAARLPSRSSAGSSLDPLPLFGLFAGTMQASDVSPASRSGLWHTAFPNLPGGCLPSGTDETSQFLYEGLFRMLRVSDRVEPSDNSQLALSWVLPSAKDNSVGAPDFRFRGSMAGLRLPLSTLRRRPRGRRRMTRGQGGSLLLSCIELASTILRQFHWRTIRPVKTAALP
jgi:hypothetical protein